MTATPTVTVRLEKQLIERIDEYAALLSRELKVRVTRSTAIRILIEGGLSEGKNWK